MCRPSAGSICIANKNRQRFRNPCPSCLHCAVDCTILCLHLGFVASAWCARHSQVWPETYNAADIHDPFTTVHEALRFSAHLRINDHPDNSTVETFVEEVMGLVELEPLRCHKAACICGRRTDAWLCVHFGIVLLPEGHLPELEQPAPKATLKL